MSRARNPYRRAGAHLEGTGWTSYEDSPCTVDNDRRSEPGQPLHLFAELRHGWTLADIIRIANASAANNCAYSAVDFGEAAWVAQAAIVDHLYTAETPPSRRDLAYAGKAAIWRAVNEVRQHHGYRNRDPWEGYGSAPHFAIFWNCPPDGGHEERCLEELAVGQVIAALRETDRQVLLTAAAFAGDHDAAAAATGRNLRAWRKALQVARAAATAAWYAPETPASQRLRRLDYRHHRGDPAPCGTIAAVRRHRGRRENLDPACAAAELAYDRTRKGRTP